MNNILKTIERFKFLIIIYKKGKNEEYFNFSGIIYGNTYLGND